MWVMSFKIQPPDLGILVKILCSCEKKLLGLLYLFMLYSINGSFKSELTESNLIYNIECYFNLLSYSSPVELAVDKRRMARNINY